MHALHPVVQSAAIQLRLWCQMTQGKKVTLRMLCTAGSSHHGFMRIYAPSMQGLTGWVATMKSVQVISCTLTCMISEGLAPARHLSPHRHHNALMRFYAPEMQALTGWAAILRAAHVKCPCACPALIR